MAKGKKNGIAILGHLLSTRLPHLYRVNTNFSDHLYCFAIKSILNKWKFLVALLQNNFYIVPKLFHGLGVTWFVGCWLNAQVGSALELNPRLLNSAT